MSRNHNGPDLPAAPPLSKSDYLAGLQCPRLLWWRVHEPDAEEFVPDVALRARLEQGHQVTARARESFPGGVLVSGNTLPTRIAATGAAIKSGARTLFEAAFEANGAAIVADILDRRNGAWTLVEVKSSTKIKPEHLPDVAVQLYVVRAAGVRIDRAELMFLNRDCRSPDLSDLFVRENVTGRATQRLWSVESELKELRSVLAGPLPAAEAGRRCSEPHVCPFTCRCCAEQPLNGLETLHRPRPGQIDCLRDLGYQNLAQACDDLLPTRVQSRQRKAALINDVVAEPELAHALHGLCRPIAFLDFETLGPAIPVWNGCRPYDPTVVQLSVHTEHEDGTLTHTAWLACGPEDPRAKAARAIIEATLGAATILVYHQSFEAQRIRELQEAVPEAAEELESVLDRMVDLLPIVRDHVYHPGFRGSFSLKRVLPALIPDLSYDDLAIRDGDQASATLKRFLLDGSVEEAERARMRRELLDYCQRDTLAMVRLVQRLRELAGGSGPPAA